MENGNCRRIWQCWQCIAGAVGGFYTIKERGPGAEWRRARKPQNSSSFWPSVGLAEKAVGVKTLNSAFREGFRSVRGRSHVCLLQSGGEGRACAARRGRSARFEPHRGRQDFGAHHRLGVRARLVLPQVFVAGPGDRSGIAHRDRLHSHPAAGKLERGGIPLLVDLPAVGLK